MTVSQNAIGLVKGGNARFHELEAVSLNYIKAVISKLRECMYTNHDAAALLGEVGMTMVPTCSYLLNENRTSLDDELFFEYDSGAKDKTKVKEQALSLIMNLACIVREREWQDTSEEEQDSSRRSRSTLQREEFDMKQFTSLIRMSVLAVSRYTDATFVAGMGITDQATTNLMVSMAGLCAAYLIGSEEQTRSV